MLFTSQPAFTTLHGSFLGPRTSQLHPQKPPLTLLYSTVIQFCRNIPFGINSYKFIALKTPCFQQLQKNQGGYPLNQLVISLDPVRREIISLSQGAIQRPAFTRQSQFTVCRTSLFRFRLLVAGQDLVLSGAEGSPVTITAHRPLTTVHLAPSMIDSACQGSRS